ncbi:hypothetical protein [Streptomyces cavernae]|uniref:hypothetical protein n=1 Tax=Streptomyces cavernae TaxID=2259034 RepID=UPI000FEBA708|nr:hypothetical protein [Streptomyces cavernae]
MYGNEGLVARYGTREPALRRTDLLATESGAVALLGTSGAGRTPQCAVSGGHPLHGVAIGAGSINFLGRRIDGADPAAALACGPTQVPNGRHVFGDPTVDHLRRGGLTPTASGQYESHLRP